MTIAYAIHRTVLGLDQLLSKGQLRISERRGSLVSLYFHTLFADRNELNREQLDPQQATTVEDFRQALNYFKEEGFRFVTVEQIMAGLNQEGRYVHVTFDDGYWNNLRAIPVLEELGIPATFFISAGHVQSGKAFWWDVLYRARKGQGRSDAELGRELASFVGQKTADVERALVNELGAEAMRPVGDLDRPLTEAELRSFASHRLVSIGNHTVDHAVLTGYMASEVSFQITRAQEMLKEMTGRAPVSIAYPNGNYSPGIVENAKKAGLRIGFSTEPRKEYVARLGRRDHLMHLGRFCPFGGRDLREQCEYFRSDIMLHERYQRSKNLLKYLLKRGASRGG